MLPPIASRPAGVPPLLPGPTLLTIRRQVDYCRVAAALCCQGHPGTASH